MAETYKKLNIDIYNGTNAIITQVQQDTNSRYLDVFLYDNGLPVDLTDHEVRIYARKPLKSGQEYAFEVWNNGEITEPTNGRCQFLLTTQMLAQVGYVELQVEMWLNNEKILSTPIFVMCVTESLRTNGTVESSNEYGALVVLFQNLYESIDLMTEMVQNFGIAGDVAQQIPVTTFWEMLEAVYSMTKRAYENASVAQVLEEIGDTTDTGATESTGTIYGKLNNIIANRGVIKSVQRGTFATTSTSSYAVTISSVDTSKSIILLFGGAVRSSGDYVGQTILPYVDTFDARVFRVKGYSYGGSGSGTQYVYPTISWQVVEFY